MEESNECQNGCLDTKVRLQIIQQPVVATSLPDGQRINLLKKSNRSGVIIFGAGEC